MLVVRLWSPFEILAKFIEVHLSSGLAKAVGDVVHRGLLQPQAHQGLVATLRGTVRHGLNSSWW